MNLSLKNLSLLALIGVSLVAPYYLYPIFLMKIICFALFACAFNLLVGFTGLLSFGHACFFGTAGYVAGYFIKSHGVGFEASLIIATCAAMLIGLLVGGLAIRRQGIYFTMITLALSQMIYFLVLQAPVTGGEDGMQSIARGYFLGFIDLKSDINIYYVMLLLFLLGYMLIERTINSPFGQILTAIKENENRAISLGYDVDKYKLMAFVLSAGLSGLAGAMKANVLGFATLTDVHWTMSGLVILMTLVGGMGTRLGPILGAAVIMTLETKLGDIGDWLVKVTHVDAFRFIGESVTMVTGLIFIVCVMLFRKGIIGEFNALVKR